jgi:hypothetical protein
MDEEKKFFVKWVLKKLFIKPFVNEWRDFRGMFKRNSNPKESVKKRVESLKKFVRKPKFYESIFWIGAVFFLFLSFVKHNFLWLLGGIVCIPFIFLMKIWWYWSFNKRWKKDYEDVFWIKKGLPKRDR